MTTNINVLGIAGREGVGKTTVANMLTRGPVGYEMREISNPLLYVASIIYGVEYPSAEFDEKIDNDEPDPIWGMTLAEITATVRRLIVIHIGLEWVKRHQIWKAGNHIAPYDTEVDGSTSWREFSLASPLKKMCSVLFDIPYDVLLAQTPEARKIREEIKTHDYPVCGAITGRQCLEYFGTDIMRNNFDQDIWLKIMRRDADRALARGLRVVIPDVRFTNEGQMIDDMGGTLLVIYRNESDLTLTDADRETHPAKWHFLTFYRNATNRMMLENALPLEHLRKKLQTIKGLHLPFSEVLVSDPQEQDQHK